MRLTRMASLDGRPVRLTAHELAEKEQEYGMPLPRCDVCCLPTDNFYNAESWADQPDAKPFAEEFGGDTAVICLWCVNDTAGND